MIGQEKIPAKSQFANSKNVKATPGVAFSLLKAGAFKMKTNFLPIRTAHKSDPAGIWITAALNFLRNFGAHSRT